MIKNPVPLHKIQFGWGMYISFTELKGVTLFLSSDFNIQNSQGICKLESAFKFVISWEGLEFLFWGLKYEELASTPP